MRENTKAAFAFYRLLVTTLPRRPRGQRYATVRNQPFPRARCRYSDIRADDRDGWLQATSHGCDGTKRQRSACCRSRTAPATYLRLSLRAPPPALPRLSLHLLRASCCHAHNSPLYPPLSALFSNAFSGCLAPISTSIRLRGERDDDRHSTCSIRWRRYLTVGVTACAGETPSPATACRCNHARAALTCQQPPKHRTGGRTREPTTFGRSNVCSHRTA